MTVKEGSELVKILRQEIKEGKDVDFNNQWIECLNKSILKAINPKKNKLKIKLKINFNPTNKQLK